MSVKPGTPFTINSRKYDGTIRRSWQCELVATQGDAIDLVGRFEIDVEHPDLGRIERGTISHERFYLNRWYNFFRFEDPAGTLRNYYINICLPPSVADGVIDYVDLDIDIIVWPDGRIVTLDVDEFESNARSFGYPVETQNTAHETLKKLLELLEGCPVEQFEHALHTLDERSNI